MSLLLVKAFRHIEERAGQSGEDLYDAYRLSADTAKIDKIENTALLRSYRTF